MLHLNNCFTRAVKTLALLCFVGGTLSAQFSGGLKVDFRQSANNDPDFGGSNGIHWINSILQETNSNYVEGMSSLQRIVLANVAATPGNVHTLQFGHQFSKGGSKAYDFLTGNSYDALTGWNVAYENVNGIPSETIIGQYQCYQELGPPAVLFGLCNDLHTITATNPASSDPNVIDVELPDDAFPGVQQRINAYEAINGNRYIRIYGNSAITSAYFLPVTHSDDDLGDSYVDYNLVVVTSSTSLIIELGGHLAIGGLTENDTDGMKWGLNKGAASIDGGPYHFKLYRLGGSLISGTNNLTQSESLGSQDNQIKAGDIIPLTCECNIVGETGPVCPNGVYEYCAPEGTVSSVWSITGNATFTESGNCVQLNAGVACGQLSNFVITLTTTNAEGCITECELDVAVIDTISPVVVADGNVANGGSLGANPSDEDINNALGSVTSVTDDCGGGNIVVTNTDSGTSSTGGCGYARTRSFSATDLCGNTTVVTRTINWIVDTIAPVIEYVCVGSSSNNIDLGCNPGNDEINTTLCITTITDNCDSDSIVITYEADTVSTPGCNYSLTRTVTATDRYGNTRTTSRSVSYKLDTDAPVITA
ncbi:MAG: hypothetical protein ACKOW8_11715, partial [Flavobacteriales bacterium]